MKTLGIVLLTIYLVILLIILVLQILFSIFFDQDRDTIPWKLILENTFSWPVILIKFIIGVIK